MPPAVNIATGVPQATRRWGHSGILGPFDPTWNPQADDSQTRLTVRWTKTHKDAYSAPALVVKSANAVEVQQCAKAQGHLHGEQGKAVVTRREPVHLPGRFAASATTNEQAASEG